MRISTFDPISMQKVNVLDDAPFIIEGTGEEALKIYFEDDINKAEYLDIPLYSSLYRTVHTAEPAINAAIPQTAEVA